MNDSRGSLVLMHDAKPLNRNDLKFSRKARSFAWPLPPRHGHHQPQRTYISFRIVTLFSQNMTLYLKHKWNAKMFSKVRIFHRFFFSSCRQTYYQGDSHTIFSPVNGKMANFLDFQMFLQRLILWKVWKFLNESRFSETIFENWP